MILEVAKENSYNTGKDALHDSIQILKPFFRTEHLKLEYRNFSAMCANPLMVYTQFGLVDIFFITHTRDLLLSLVVDPQCYKISILDPSIPLTLPSIFLIALHVDKPKWSKMIFGKKKEIMHNLRLIINNYPSLCMQETLYCISSTLS